MSKFLFYSSLRFSLYSLLFLTFSFFLLPCSYADYADGNGSPEFPYQIAEPNQLIYMSQHPEHWDLNFILTADINLALAEPNTFTTALIAPDPNNSNYTFDGTPFIGIFDGNGHTIFNLNIDTAGEGNAYLGLFGLVKGSNAEVKILDLENARISGGNNSWILGGLCGGNYDGNINNCHVSGLVTGNNYLGGLCGGNSGNINNCYSTGSVYGVDNSGYFVGGLCGANTGDINNCYSIGSVTGGDNFESLGGLCGAHQSGSINNCYAISTVTGGDYSEYIGGLCGQNLDGDIINCFTSSSVICGTFSIHLGGLCGENHGGSISYCTSNSSINGGDNSDYLGCLCGYNNGGFIYKCSAAGSVTGGSYLGGLCGWNMGGIGTCYATSSVAGRDGSYFLGGLCGASCDIIGSCYATGSVTGNFNSNYIGGLCGYGSEIYHCYSTGLVIGGDNADYLGGLCGGNPNSIYDCYFLDTAGPDNGCGEPLSDPNMRIQSSFVDWDFVGEEDNGIDDHWQMCLDGYDYPRLAWQFINPADFLHPGRVDNYDLFVFTQDWLNTDSRCCDIAPTSNPDGIVNLFDYTEFTKYWLKE